MELVAGPSGVEIIKLMSDPASSSSVLSVEMVQVYQSCGY